jgi:hypothetical protein
MPTCRVTYVDSVLREVVVTTDTADDAETLVREQMEQGEHHHAIHTWTDDWQAETHVIQAKHNWHCFECGRLLR